MMRVRVSQLQGLARCHNFSMMNRVTSEQTDSESSSQFLEFNAQGGDWAMEEKATVIFSIKCLFWRLSFDKVSKVSKVSGCPGLESTACPCRKRWLVEGLSDVLARRVTRE
jgi:hypothetical protein